MHEFVAGKSACIQLRQVVEELARDTGQPCGVLASFGAEDLPVSKILLTDQNVMAFTHPPPRVQDGNTTIRLQGSHSRRKSLPGTLPCSLVANPAVEPTAPVAAVGGVCSVGLFMVFVCPGYGCRGSP